MTAKRKDFFISYTSADAQWAEWIAWQLEAAGYTTFLQAWDFKAGRNIVQLMNEGTQSKRTIIVLSPDYLRKLYTQPEWQAAFFQDPTGKKGKLLPIRVRECKLEGLQAPIAYIDLINQKPEAAREIVLQAAADERMKPTKEPAFPNDTATSKPKPGFPSQPAVWTVPFHRHRFFTGREEILQQLADSLEDGGRMVLKQAVHGGGGVGKTQIAVEFAYRHQASFDTVLWIDAEDPVNLPAGIELLARKLKIPEFKIEQDSVEAVREWLEHNQRWLLILDNVTKPEDVTDYLPRIDTGAVIITSRNPGWDGVANALKINVLPPEEAVKLVLVRTGSEDTEVAAELAKALGYLPLALTQATSYIKACGETLSGYWELFRTRRRELWQDEAPPDDYTRPIATSLNLAFDQLSENATTLLETLAFFAPEPLSRSLLFGITGDEGEWEPLWTDRLALNRSLAELIKFGLLDSDGDSVTMHRLLRDVVRDRLTEESLPKSWRTATRILLQEFEFHDAVGLQTIRRDIELLAHAFALVDEACPLASVVEQSTNLMNQVAGLMHQRSRLRESKRLHELAIKIKIQVYGDSHPILANSYGNLATVERDIGDFERARAFTRKAIEINTTLVGVERLALATNYSNLALIELDLGNLVDAEKFLQESVQIEEQFLPPRHPAFGTTYSNLAMCKCAAGDHAGAKALLQDAIPILEQYYGQDHPTVLTACSNLANIECELGEFELGKNEFQRIIKICEDEDQPIHSLLAINYMGMAVSEEGLGQYEKARSWMLRAVAVYEDIFESDSLKLAEGYSNLAKAERTLKNLPGACEKMQKAVRIFRIRFGSNYRRTREAEAWLAEHCSDADGS